MLDVYLDNPGLPKSWLVEKKESLESVYWSLEMELGHLQAQLSDWHEFKAYYTEMMSDPERWKKFVMSVGLKTTDKDEVIERLDVRGTLYVDDGVKKVHVKCTLGESVLCLSDHHILKPLLPEFFSS